MLTAYIVVIVIVLMFNLVVAVKCGQKYRNYIKIMGCDQAKYPRFLYPISFRSLVGDTKIDQEYRKQIGIISISIFISSFLLSFILYFLGR